MKKRVCETCFFFQEAGFAKNGWCNHPQRKQSSDVKLVVRRGELPCRNGWSQDLWLAKAAAAAADIVIDPAPAIRAEPPASVEEVSFLVNSRSEKSPAPEPPILAGPVDLVVGETPSTSPAKTTKPAQQSPSLLHQDPRSAILKAREQYRARKQAEARGPEFGQQLLERAATAPPPSVDDRAVNVRMSNTTTFDRTGRRDEVPPVRLSELPRTFPTITTFPEDEARFSTVPDPVENIALPRARPEPVPQLPQPVVASSPAEEPIAEPPARDEGMLSSATTNDRRSAESWLDAGGDPNEPESDGWVAPERFERPPRRRWLRGRAMPVRPVWRAEDLDSRFAETVELDELARLDAAPDLTARAAEAGRRRVDLFEAADAGYGEAPALETPPAFIDDSVVVPLYAEAAEPEPAIEIAPGVPRMCRTCRDFRPADNGERGWCTNSWAFSHRRMVDADELPCETSVGLWWLPHDDIWLTIADASAHGQPTPLVDQWLSHAAALHDEAGEPRRRRRS